MKKILRLIFILTIAAVLSCIVNAQPSVTHTPRDGDRLHPGLDMEGSLILAVSDSARTVLVDPTAVSFDSDGDAFIYVDSDTISYVQFATKHRFTLHGDTLCYIGYENRATDFRLDSVAHVTVFPLSGGSAVLSEWTGSMKQHGTMMLKHVKGESRSSVESGWTVTDGTDTLRNATRLKWALDMAYADPDSVTPSMPDSVASGLISDMQVDVKALLSERLLTERTMWFSEEARYPVLTESRVSRIVTYTPGAEPDTIPVSNLAMHYPPSFQHADTGEDMIRTKPREGGEIERYDGKAGSGDLHTLEVGEPETVGRTLTVTVSSPSGPATVTLTLFTDSGIRLTEPLEITSGTLPQPCSIPVPAGWSGVVILRIDSGEESYTRKAII